VHDRFGGRLRGRHWGKAEVELWTRDDFVARKPFAGTSLDRARAVRAAADDPAALARARAMAGGDR
jgi:hypothetical protein